MDKTIAFLRLIANKFYCDHILVDTQKATLKLGK